MTIAEQLREKGRELGIQQGIALGRQEGEHSASLKIARQLLAHGVERTLVKISTGLSDDELASLFDDGR